MKRRLSPNALLPLVAALVACGAGTTNVAPRETDTSLVSKSSLAALAELSPEVLPPPPADASNRYADDPAAATLGQQLFFDPGFSGQLLDPDNTGGVHSLGSVGESGKVSCAGCHLPESGFVDTRSARQTVSLAAGWGKRKAPSVLDVGQAKVIMWDGAHDATYNQPFGALENGVEMNSSRLYAAEQIYKRYRPAYEAIFGPISVALDDPDQFPQLDGKTTGCRSLSNTMTGVSTGVNCHGMPGDKAEFDGLAGDELRDAVTQVWVNAGKAIAAYERLLTCGQSRFDQWMHGKTDALSESEQRGAALFVGQRADGVTGVGCNSCHSGPFMTDQSFHNLGIEPGGTGPAGTFIDADDHGLRDGLAKTLDDPLNVKGKFSDGDDGRLEAAQAISAADGAFRTPSMRCVTQRPSFMHTGQMRGLSDAMKFLSTGGNTDGYPGTNELTVLNLSPGEMADLMAFLDALTGPGPSAELRETPTLP